MVLSRPPTMGLAQKKKRIEVDKIQKNTEQIKNVWQTDESLLFKK